MNLGIVGNGNIVKTALEALREMEKIHVVAICVREQSREKGAVLQKEYDIPLLYTSYEQFLGNEDIGFVYIGVINPVHYEYARKALTARKNVILEKPSCVKSAEIEDLIKTTKEKGLYLFEAVIILHTRFFREIEASLPSLGRIRLAQCNFSKFSSRYKDYLKGDIHPVFSPSMAGGSLMDINIYNINYMVSLLGVPGNVRYYANRGYNGIDLSGIVVMEYDGFVASCAAAKDSSSPGFMQIQGENGWLKIEGDPSNLHELIVDINGKGRRTLSLQTSRNRMTDEFASFLAIYEARDRDTMYHFLDISVGVAQVAEAAFRSME